MLSLQKFDGFIGFIIMINSVTIGWESQEQIAGRSTEVFEEIEHIFLGIYVFELGARFFGHGEEYVDAKWKYC
jgi:hypothetical protein